MRLSVQMKLLPTPDEAAALAATLQTCNTLANQVSAVAFARFGVKARQFELRRLCYGDLKSQV